MGLLGHIFNVSRKIYFIRTHTYISNTYMYQNSHEIEKGGTVASCGGSLVGVLFAFALPGKERMKKRGIGRGNACN